MHLSYWFPPCCHSIWHILWQIFLIYASNEPKSVFTGNFGDCHDNYQKIAKRVFYSFSGDAGIDCGYDISMKLSGKTTQQCRIANVYRYVSRAATATVCVHGFTSFFQNELCAKKNIAEKGLSVRTTCFADTINVHAGRRFVNGKKWNFVGGTALRKPAGRMEHILSHSLGRFS